VVLQHGDIFRAKDGPYYLAEPAGGGKRVRVSMAAKGPFVFLRLAKYRSRAWIEAFSKRDGGFAALAITKRRSPAPGIIVARPYRVTGKVRSLAGRPKRRRLAS
jgi:hypothetical protein